jgi:antitoxin (DNA-binding transcriptional repressor) of toxin-antitoxin stability system
MITISKSKLKSHMLRLFRDVQKSGDEIIVTDHGKPVLKISPIPQKENVRDIFADVVGGVKYFEDILTPMTDEWDDV